MWCRASFFTRPGGDHAVQGFLFLHGQGGGDYVVQGFLLYPERGKGSCGAGLPFLHGQGGGSCGTGLPFVHGKGEGIMWCRASFFTRKDHLALLKVTNF